MINPEFNSSGLIMLVIIIPHPCPSPLRKNLLNQLFLAGRGKFFKRIAAV
jgi:hypothetical protein